LGSTSTETQAFSAGGIPVVFVGAGGAPEAQDGRVFYALDWEAVGRIIQDH
jgi:hypothetical protein